MICEFGPSYLISRFCSQFHVQFHDLQFDLFIFVHIYMAVSSYLLPLMTSEFILILAGSLAFSRERKRKISFAGR